MTGVFHHRQMGVGVLVPTCHLRHHAALQSTIQARCHHEDRIRDSTQSHRHLRGQTQGVSTSHRHRPLVQRSDSNCLHDYRERQTGTESQAHRRLSGQTIPHPHRLWDRIADSNPHHRRLHPQRDVDECSDHFHRHLQVQVESVTNQDARNLVPQRGVF